MWKRSGQNRPASWMVNLGYSSVWSNLRFKIGSCGVRLGV